MSNQEWFLFSGQFEGSYVDVEADTGKLTFVNEPDRNPALVTLEYRKNSLNVRAPCWFVSGEGEGLIYGTKQDYRIYDNIQSTSIAPGLKQFPKM